MLEVKALKKSYGDFSVSLDLSVGAGETLALAGPSGCGKTTALNLIAGLIEPESGSVIIDGEDITRLPAWKRNISVVFQDLALFPHLDVGGNIAYGLFIRGVPKKNAASLLSKLWKLSAFRGMLRGALTHFPAESASGSQLRALLRPVRARFYWTNLFQVWTCLCEKTFAVIFSRFAPIQKRPAFLSPMTEKKPLC